MFVKQKGLSNIKLIIIIASTLILVGGISFLIYSRIKNNNTNTPSTTKSTTTDTTTSNTNNSSVCSPSDSMYVVPAVGVNLRGDKSTTAALILTIPFGTQITAGCGDGTWSKVVYQGQMGYAQSQYLTKDNPSIFIIKEFGIKLTVGGSITDLTYSYNNSDVNHPYVKFTTKSLLAADSNCNTDFGPVGALTYSTVSPASQPEGPGDGTFIKALGGKYLYFSGPQAYCSTNSTTQTLAASQLKALQAAASSAQLN